MTVYIDNVMTVYIDNALLLYCGMKMCHMIADTDEELHAMARKLGLRREWCQSEGTDRVHYDVALMRRRLAIKYGAIPTTSKEIVHLLKRKASKST